MQAEGSLFAERTPHPGCRTSTTPGCATSTRGSWGRARGCPGSTPESFPLGPSRGIPGKLKLWLLADLVPRLDAHRRGALVPVLRAGLGLFERHGATRAGVLRGLAVGHDALFSRLHPSHCVSSVSSQGDAKGTVSAAQGERSVFAGRWVA